VAPPAEGRKEPIEVCVARDQREAVFAAGHRQQGVIGQRWIQVNRCPTVARSELRKESATLTKRQRRRREHSTAALEGPEYRRLKLSNLFAGVRAGGKFLNDHGAEKRPRERLLEKRGQRLGERLIAERVDEDVRVERELHA